jgi:RNA polymerase sigma-70 factor, ECF subfamily
MMQLSAGQNTAETGIEIDARLLAAATRQDAKAFAQLMERHYRVVYRVVWRLMNGHSDSEDVTQEAFLRLWKNPQQLREAGALRQWLIRVANNIVMDRLRGKKTMALDDTIDVVDTTPGALQNMERDTVRQRIDVAIARLPERQRLALTLVQFEQFSQQAAADTMEVSLDAFESLISRARRALKQDLAGEWQELLAGLAE